MQQVTIRTTNWSRINQFLRTKETIVTPAERKARIVRRLKKRYEKNVVCAVSRRWGKLTMLTNYFLLCKLESALLSGDKNQIKAIINKRINAKGGVNGYHKRTNRRTS